MSRPFTSLFVTNSLLEVKGSRVDHLLEGADVYHFLYLMFERDKLTECAANSRWLVKEATDKVWPTMELFVKIPSNTHKYPVDW